MSDKLAEINYFRKNSKCMSYYENFQNEECTELL